MPIGMIGAERNKKGRLSPALIALWRRPQSETIHK
jgi:hypothetical protein